MSISQKLKIKALSVNQCWQGRRFKTPLYKDYEERLMWVLKNGELPEKPYLLSIEVGFSNKASDIDNVLKSFLDILQKKYGFNDNEIYRIEAQKTIVKKGDEFINFSLSHLS